MQFRDLKRQYDFLKPNIDRAIFDVINDSNFILGKQVDELEEKLASYVGRKYCVSCANGTDALVLALMAMGVGKDDAVFVPDFTYIATASSVSFVGATPIFVDIDLDTFNMSPKSLELMIEKVIKEDKLKLKAIIPVDLFGLPADYNNISEIANKYKLKVIEDAAQGFGGRINNKIACSFGDISCTSFFPAKPLGCYGDGGAIFTDDEEIYNLIKSLRSNGKSETDKYDNIRIGMNSRLDTIQAAILNVKFDAFVNSELENINAIANKYTKNFKNKFKTPHIPDKFFSSWAQYTILCDSEDQRNKFKSVLKDNDIPSMIYYPRGMHQQKCFSKYKFDNNYYSNTIEATKRVLSLPMHPYLSDKEIDEVCNIINKV